eukprot:m.36358 g.36358  ORF g.36358 m.36358 type:complete len:152 (+) comp5383_c1_seq2:39-494(+)
MNMEGPSPVVRPKDGQFFSDLLAKTITDLTALCGEYAADQLANDGPLSEEVDGKIRAAVGKAQLLMAKRFPQFKDLCTANLDPSAALRPRDADLEGYWELISFSVSELEQTFKELAALRANKWEPLTPVASVSIQTDTYHIHTGTYICIHT